MKGTDADPRRRAHNLALGAMAEAAGLPGVRVESIRQGCYSDADVATMIERHRATGPDWNPQISMPDGWD